jgi:hypothetical protein
MENGIDAKPPWGGYGTFWNFVSQLHEDDGLPQVLDRSVMGNRGGSARTELYAALKFFGLMDDAKRPTEALRALAASPTAETWRPIVERAYAPVIDLGLLTATSSQVGEALSGMGASPSTVARARAFFLNAAEQAGIPVGNTLKTKRAPAAAPRRRPTRTKKQPVVDDPITPVVEQPKLPVLIGALVAKLPEKEWTAAEAKQWLALVAPAIAYDYNLNASELTAAAGES